MFATLAQERRKRMINQTHNKVIRECVLDLVEDDNGESSIDSDGILFDDENEIPDDVLDSVEAKVDDIIKDKDVADMTDDELDVVADQIIGSLDSLDFGTQN